MDVNQILDTLAQAEEEKKAKAPPPKFQAHVWNEKPDSDGLPMEHKGYIKRNCKNCSGRGVVVKVVSNDPEKKTVTVANACRKEELCGCVHKGYAKLRLAFQRELSAELKLLKDVLQKDPKKGPTEDTVKEALAKRYTRKLAA